MMMNEELFFKAPTSVTRIVGAAVSDSTLEAISRASRLETRKGGATSLHAI
jgi:hypothetical protein